MQLVSVRTEALDGLRPRPVDARVNVGDCVGVAHPDNTDIALADLAGPFKLYPQLRGRNVARPGDAGGALVIGLVAALAHVDVTAEKIFKERVGPLIHRVAGNRSRSAALLG